MAYSIGIDLGGTKIIIGLVDQAGKIQKSVQLPTRVPSDPAAIVQDIVSAINKLRHGNPIDCIGVGMAGQVVKKTGVVHFAPHLGWKDFPLQQQLEDALQLPVAVTNDVRAAAWGEWLYGAGQGCDDLVCIFVGTGIGGGVVCGGKMLSGSTNTAAEIGHMILDLQGPECSCGSRGCFDALAGGDGIARRAKRLVATDPTGGKPLILLAGGNAERITTRHVFEAYRQGIPLAILILEHVKTALVAGVSSVVNAFNPSRVIMGGGIMDGNPDLIEIIRQGVSKTALEAAVESLEIVPSALKSDAGVIGAAVFARQEGE